VQLTTWLVETLKSGKVTVSQNNVEALKIKAEDKKIDVNVTEKKFIKEIISSAREGSSIKGSVNQIKVARDMRPLLKEIVEDLCKEGVTITISYKGDRVATIGSEANSKFTRLVTGTRGIEINSPAKLIEMGV
jgi:hypothetical protein